MYGKATRNKLTSWALKGWMSIVETHHVKSSIIVRCRSVGEVNSAEQFLFFTWVYDEHNRHTTRSKRARDWNCYQKHDNHHRNGIIIIIVIIITMAFEVRLSLTE